MTYEQKIKKVLDLIEKNGLVKFTSETKLG